MDEPVSVEDDDVDDQPVDTDTSDFLYHLWTWTRTSQEDTFHGGHNKKKNKNKIWTGTGLHFLQNQFL